MMSLGWWPDRSKTLLANTKKCFSGKKIAAPRGCLKKRISAKKSVFFGRGRINKFHRFATVGSMGLAGQLSAAEQCLTLDMPGRNKVLCLAVRPRGLSHIRINFYYVFVCVENKFQEIWLS